jgi:triosephosphate isomerase
MLLNLDTTEERVTMAGMMPKLIVANWKMHVASSRDAVRLARASDYPHVVICPPFVYLEVVRRTLNTKTHKLKAHLGAQDVFWEEQGPYTGEISPKMLKEKGVRHVLVGHSERRRWLGETDQMISRKIRTALFAGLKVILCVGEPLAVRKRGFVAAKRFVRNQLKKDLRDISNIQRRTSNLIIAYEPIWAIGTGKPDDPKNSAEMATFIKNQVPGTRHPIPVLYGGSVTSKNAARIFQYKEIDGALVGGASVKVSEFRKIISAASQ